MRGFYFFVVVFGGFLCVVGFFPLCVCGVGRLFDK